MASVQKPAIVAYEVWYTRAPLAYDGFGTIVLTGEDKTGAYDLQGNPLRKVGILQQYSDWQRNRYGSGMYPAYTDDEIKEMMNS